MKKYLLIVLVVSVLSALNAKIIETRTFDVIEFNDGRMTNKSKNYFKAIVGTIKSYIENKKNIRIQVIGYTRTEVDRHEELKVNSDSYSIQHDFSFVESKDEAEESTTIYASYVVGKLEKNKIPKNLITKEFHNFKLLGYTSIKDKEKGLDLPNRVTITMHVLKRKSNKKVLPKVVVPVVVVEKKVEKVIVPSVVVPAVVAEKKVEKVVVPAVIVPAAVVEKKVEKAIVPTVIIPAVVVEKKVEKVVVPTEVVEKKVEKEILVDSDNDGVDDSLDKCLKTRNYVKVDESGCPIDSDKDGVFDYKDVCSNTPYGMKVYENGCPIRKK